MVERLYYLFEEDSISYISSSHQIKIIVQSIFMVEKYVSFEKF